MAQGGMRLEDQRRFRYLLERMSEPLGMGMKGPKDNMVLYNVPQNELWSAKNPRLAQANPRSQINVQMPSNMPMEELRQISSMCPRQGLFGYFIPEHRQACMYLKKIFMSQQSTEDLFNMACACRDSSMVNSHLFVNALASCMNLRKDIKNFDMPALYEVMPEIFFSDHCIKQAEKMARMPESEAKVISVDRDQTGNQSDPENRMAYFREDIGINSHHFHWHIVFPGEYEMKNKRNRRGELFYYMHHSMVARYETERLCNSLSRTKVFDFDNLMIEEGYFGKLYSINAARHWGTRQANTKLNPILRKDSVGDMEWDLKIEDLKKWRDRILEAIDTGFYIRGATGAREKLAEGNGIDILGDMIENADDTPHKQFYGPSGFHNMGHLLIAYSNDPNGKYKENFGPMGDTATAMRDPAFYRWHKYIDQLFDQYKKTLEPYELNRGNWPLIWQNIKVEQISVRKPNSEANMLTTHWMQTDIDLARGLDFFRTDALGGPIWARVTHLNYDEFEYYIQVTNSSTKQEKATVRIFMAPKQDEHGRNLTFTQQRLLFFELDKFTKILNPGMNNIVQKSTESSVTIKMENSFRLLEQLDTQKPMLNAQEGRCGCGWPQHMLLPKGTASGIKFDLFVIITDGDKDSVPQSGKECRDAMSFCGVLDEVYPDKRPMGYPFDRVPYKPMQGMINSLDDYVRNIPNAGATQFLIKHEESRVRIARGGAPSNMPMVNDVGETVNQKGPSPMNEPPRILNNGNGNNFNRPPPRNPPRAGYNLQWDGPPGEGYRDERQENPEEEWDVLDNYDDMRVDSPRSRY